MRYVGLAAALFLSTAAAAADVEHAFQSAVARGAIRRVVIDIPAANFTLRTATDDRLSLSGIVSRDYDTSKERDWAQKVVNDTSVEFYVSGSEAVVRRKFGPNAQSWRAQRFTGLDLRLDLPPGIAVDFETTAGDVNLAGDFGHIDLDLTAGEIRLQMPRSRVRELRASARVGEVRTTMNNERVTREGVFPKAATFSNPSGSARVNLHVTAGEIDVTLTD